MTFINKDEFNTNYIVYFPGIRILDGPVTDALEAKALMYQKDHIDVKSASWGPHDDGRTMEGPSPACKEALQKAVKTVSCSHQLSCI